MEGSTMKHIQVLLTLAAFFLMTAVLTADDYYDTGSGSYI